MEKKHQVIIDKDKCVGCGLCKKDCVGFDIDIVDGKAVSCGKSCIMCGHCEAICPQGAVTITGFRTKLSSLKSRFDLIRSNLWMQLKREEQFDSLQISRYHKRLWI